MDRLIGFVVPPEQAAPRTELKSSRLDLYKGVTELVAVPVGLAMIALLLDYFLTILSRWMG